jgi:rod shape-determining protein MreC
VQDVQVLSALVDFAQADPENEYLGAAVIAYDPSPFMKYVIINRGSDDALRRGMPVVTSQGLVGRIVAVTSVAARVQLITDPGSQINVQLTPSEAEGLLSGQITGEVTLEDLPQDATIQAGDLVLTSGLGGNFPAGIIIGQVTGVRQHDYDLFQSASVQPVVDFSKLEIVLVITNFDPVDITPLIP